MSCHLVVRLLQSVQESLVAKQIVVVLYNDNLFFQIILFFYDKWMFKSILKPQQHDNHVRKCMTLHPLFKIQNSPARTLLPTPYKMQSYSNLSITSWNLTEISQLYLLLSSLYN